MGILSILYPKRCPVCHNILQGTGDFCPSCRKKLHYIQEPRCKKCGKALGRPEQEYCRDCMRFPHSFDRGAAVFAYDKIMQHSIAMFKYHNRREYAEVYAEEMYRRYRRFLQLCAPDVILPVPVHALKKRQRGFNQAELVARELGKKTGILVDTGYLVRIQKTTPQKELSRQQRKANLRKAFDIREKGVSYERVLLIDDIYTTGATMDAISDILKENGVKKVFFLTICVGTDGEM